MTFLQRGLVSISLLKILPLLFKKYAATNRPTTLTTEQKENSSN